MTEQKKASELPTYSIIEDDNGIWLRVQLNDVGEMAYEELNPHCGECAEYVLDNPTTKSGEAFRRKWYGTIPLEPTDEVFKEFKLLALGVEDGTVVVKGSD